MSSSISVRDFLSHFSDLELLTTNHDLSKQIIVPEISRPGVELSGFVQHFPYFRIQLMGLQEIKYLEHINYNVDNLVKFFNHDIPLIIICQELEVDPVFLSLAQESLIPVVRSNQKTSKLQARLYSYLEEELAPCKQIHAECLNIYGKGVLITGASGIGKSEVALDLIKHGHFLIADDSVILRFIDKNNIIACAPKLLKNRIEIRGVGIIDITKLHGVTSVLEKTKVDLIVELKPLDGSEDRLGQNILYQEINDFKIPKIVVPISAGRNLTNLIETAVANFNLKTEYNYDASKEMIQDLHDIIEEQNDK